MMLWSIWPKVKYPHCGSVSEEGVECELEPLHMNPIHYGTRPARADDPPDTIVVMRRRWLRKPRRLVATIWKEERYELR